MFKLISFIFLCVIPFQIILLLSGFGDSLEYSIPNPPIAVFILCIFVTFSIFFLMFYAFKKYEIKIFNKINFSKFEKFISMILFIFIVVLNSYFLSQFSQVGMLNHIQGQEGLGFTFKLATVIAPASFAISVCAFRSSNKTIYFLSIIILMLSVANSASMLTKAPLISTLLVFYILTKEKLIPYSFFIYLFIASLFGISIVYIGRGDEALSNAGDILVALIFRVPLIFEGSFVLNHIFEFGSFAVDFSIIHEVITSEIFKLDSKLTGVAPTYLGFFWGLYGFIGGTFFAGFFLIPLILLVRFLISSGPFRKIRLLLYFIWAIELVPFFIDGNPSIITGTTDNKMFYALIFLTAIVTLLSKLFFIRMKSGVSLNNQLETVRLS